MLCVIVLSVKYLLVVFSKKVQFGWRMGSATGGSAADGAGGSSDDGARGSAADGPAASAADISIGS